MQFIVEDGISGLHYEAKNPIKLAEAVKRFDEDPALQKQLIDGARHTYDSKYSPERNYNRLIEIYHQVTEKSLAVS
jgi:glycosyltransferase involved in cell wall biosynthesis